MNDIMIDLETMGRPPRPVITAIGAVYFDRLVPGVLGGSFYRVVDMDSCISAGLKFDAHTIAWWLRQDGEARAAILEEPRVHLGAALQDLWKFFGPPTTRDTLRLWGNSPTFDLMNLRSAFKVVGYDEPWHYRQERCVRTVVGMYADAFTDCDDPKARYEGAADAHYALGDAITQAKYVATMYEALVVGAGNGALALQREEEDRVFPPPRDENIDDGQGGRPLGTKGSS